MVSNDVGSGTELPRESIPQTLWSLQIPLYITHQSLPQHPPFITEIPRFGYLALLLPRLGAFFAGQPVSSFHHEEVQLRNLAVGLLVDLYQPELPWRLTVGDGPEWDIGDTYINGVKEVSRCPVQGFCQKKNRGSLRFGSKKKTCDRLGMRVMSMDEAPDTRENNRPTLSGTAPRSRS